MSDVARRFEAILNQSKYHHEHEKFYAKAPLKQAVELQEASGVLKTLGEASHRSKKHEHTR